MNLTENEIRSRLREAVKTAGSQKAFAATAGVSQAHLSDMLCGNRSISDGIARMLGYCQVKLFAPINK